MLKYVKLFLSLRLESVSGFYNTSAISGTHHPDWHTPWYCSMIWFKLCSPSRINGSMGGELGGGTQAKEKPL